MDFVPHVGTKFRLVAKPTIGWAGVVYCEVLSVAAPHFLRYSWKGEEEIERVSIVDYKLEEIEGGTRVYVESHGFRRDQRLPHVEVARQGQAQDADTRSPPRLSQLSRRSSTSLTAAIIVAVTASVASAAIHGYVFVRETVLYHRPATQRMFGIPPTATAAVRLWAYHLGIYNLLLGLTALAGAVALVTGVATVGETLIIASSLAMIIAATTLVAAEHRRVRLRGFIAQAAPPFIAVVALLTMIGDLT